MKKVKKPLLVLLLSIMSLSFGSESKSAYHHDLPDKTLPSPSTGSSGFSGVNGTEIHVENDCVCDPETETRPDTTKSVPKPKKGLSCS